MVFKLKIIFQIKRWPKYDGIGSHDLCVPIPFTNKLGKTRRSWAS